MLGRVRNASLLKDLDIQTDVKPIEHSRFHFQNPDVSYTFDCPSSQNGCPVRSFVHSSKYSQGYEDVLVLGQAEKQR